MSPRRWDLMQVSGTAESRASRGIDLRRARERRSIPIGIAATELGLTVEQLTRLEVGTLTLPSDQRNELEQLVASMKVKSL